LISKYVRVVGIDDDVYAIYNNLLFKPVCAAIWKEQKRAGNAEVRSTVPNVRNNRNLSR